MGPTRNHPVLDSLAMLYLDTQLYMCKYLRPYLPQFECFSIGYRVVHHPQTQPYERQEDWPHLYLAFGGPGHVCCSTWMPSVARWLHFPGKECGEKRSKFKFQFGMVNLLCQWQLWCILTSFVVQHAPKSWLKFFLPLVDSKASAFKHVMIYQVTTACQRLSSQYISCENLKIS